MNATSQQIAARRYRIERYLTEGGMGAIYLGKKLGPGGFAKDVVLKQLLPEYTSRPEFRDLFFREARISATLDHANIVHTFDLVQSDESLFIVMEYVRGADLRTIVRRARLRRRELAPAAAIHIALEVLAGLAYAHTRKDAAGTSLEIIHRDVSPSNILCSAQGEVKLSDFGIAKASTHSSVFYRVRGKVGYMSPEQARNEAIDHRSDLYSLAVCLHEALTAERLFVGDLSTPPDEIYRQPIVPVSQKRAGIPAALDGVLGRALASSLEVRYQNATDFGEALREVAHRNGMAFSTPELAEHLREILGDDPERWLREEPAAVPPTTQKIPLASVGHEGKEASSLGVVDLIVDDAPAPDVLSPLGDRPVNENKDFDLDSLLDEKTVKREPFPDKATPPPPAADAAGSAAGAGAAGVNGAGASAAASAAAGVVGNEPFPATPPPVWTRESGPFPTLAPAARVPLPGATPPITAGTRPRPAAKAAGAPGAKAAGPQTAKAAGPQAAKAPGAPGAKATGAPAVKLTGPAKAKAGGPPAGKAAVPAPKHRPPPNIADPATPPPTAGGSEAINLATPPPGKARAAVKPPAPRVAAQPPPLPPPPTEFEEATPPPGTGGPPPRHGPPPARLWQTAPNLPAPPPSHRPAPPPAPRLAPPPQAEHVRRPSMPALRVPETFSFESGPVVSSRGGLTVWFTMILLLGAMVGGGWLARRLTRDDVAMLTAASTSAVRLPVGSANDGRTGARPALPTTVPLPPPTSEAPPAAPTPPSPPPAATEAEARPTPTGPGTATKASAPIPERDLPPREESGGAGVAKGGGKTGAAAQPRKAKAGGKHAKHAKSSKKRASKKGGTGRR